MRRFVMNADRSRAALRGFSLAILSAAISFAAHLGPAAAEASAKAPAEASPAKASPPSSSLGVGDGAIWLIPSLSSPSVKNGGRIAIESVVKAGAGVRSVRAEILDGDRVIDALELKLDGSRVSGLEALGAGPEAPGPARAAGPPKMGIWRAEWTAHDLEERYYTVRLIAADAAGHEFRDDSLRFSDPIVGETLPGATDSPDGGMRRVGAAYNLAQYGSFTAAAYDSVRGFAYFGTSTSPGRVVKIGFDPATNRPEYVNELILQPNDGRITAMGIDLVAGRLYAGTDSAPGRIVELNVGSGSDPITRVGSVDLAEGRVGSVLLDTDRGVAFFTADTSPGAIVKFALGAGDALPRRIGAIHLGAGEEYPETALLDPANGYAYFATVSEPTRVIKVAVGAADDLPVRGAALTLPAGDDYVVSGVIDPLNHYAYFSADVTPPKIIKVALGSGSEPPARVGALELDATENQAYCSLIDPVGGYGWFASYMIPGRVIKVALGVGDALPARVGSVDFDADHGRPFAGIINLAKRLAYFDSSSLGSIVEIALGDGANPPTLVSSTTVVSGNEGSISCGVVDAANGYAYFGTHQNPANIIKVSLGTGLEPPSRVSGLLLNPGESYLSAGLIDPSRGYAYFMGMGNPAKVVKIALNAGDAAPSRVAALNLPGDGGVVGVAIDIGSNHAYLGTANNPARLIKLALGDGDSTPTRVGAIDFEPGERNAYSGFIDPVNHYGWFGTYSYPAYVVKIRLGAGDDPPVRLGSLQLDTTMNEFQLFTAVGDVAAGYGYFGAANTGGKIIKVALGSGDQLPTRIGAVPLSPTEGNMNSSVIDPEGGYACFITKPTAFSAGGVIKIALGEGNDPPRRLGSLLLPGDLTPKTMVGDPVTGRAWIGTGYDSSSVVKLQLSQKGSLRAMAFDMPEAGAPTSVSIYSHAAKGNIRAALYTTTPSQGLLWESGSVANTVNEGRLNIPIQTGLILNPGRYLLAWEVDTTAPVVGEIPGAPGDGLWAGHEFGAAPTELDSLSPTVTGDRWSAYVSYDPITHRNAVIEFLLGITTNPIGLDLNGDGAVDAADLLQINFQNFGPGADAGAR